MSRVAKAPVAIPSGVEVKIDGQEITVKGKQGQLTQKLHSSVGVEQQDKQLVIKPIDEASPNWAQAGTARAIIANMVKGASEGFEKKLELIGVGYRAQAKGKVLSLTLGFSHPVEFELPDGISAETPTQTEVVIKGSDKQLVGQVAANVRAFRPPEPYKGKGVRYSDEYVRRKEAKKK